MHRSFLGATIMQSDSPFTVPHIIIQEAPPEDALVADTNLPVSHQDCSCSYCVPISFCGIEYISESDASYFEKFDFPGDNGVSELTPLTISSTLGEQLQEIPSTPPFAFDLYDYSCDTPDYSPDITLEELPDDFSPIEHNSTNPQDCANGMLLTVPDVDYPNVPRLECPWDDATPELSEYSSGNSSPSSPLESITEDEEDEMGEMDLADALQLADELLSQKTVTTPKPTINPKQDFRIDEDDDDGPPPFDEWYTSIAGRMQH